MGGWVGGWVGGWLDTDNRAISVQLNLTGTATGTELGKSPYLAYTLPFTLCYAAFSNKKGEIVYDD